MDEQGEFRLLEVGFSALFLFSGRWMLASESDVAQQLISVTRREEPWFKAARWLFDFEWKTHIGWANFFSRLIIWDNRIAQALEKRAILNSSNDIIRSRNWNWNSNFPGSSSNRDKSCRFCGD